LLPDYRLAPEFPFPAALDDSVRVYCWLLKSGIVPKHIVIGGDSAGSGLAASLLLALKKRDIQLPAAAVLVSAWLDLSLSGESYQSRAHVDPLTSRQELQDAVSLYIGDRDPREPFISPLFADLASLPPLLIQVGDHEVLLSDSVAFAEKAAHSNVEVELQVWEGMWHVFQAWSAGLPEGQQALDEIGRFVRMKFG
jgi:monoterpene epsilon-lactone hydrolase